MSLRYILIIIITFAGVYAGVSWIDRGEVYWAGLIGGAVGVLIAFVAVWYWRSRSRANRLTR